MTPRTFVSVFLLALIFPAHEFWQLWRGVNREVNWWMTIDYPIHIQWYFKYLGDHVGECLKAIVIYRITYKIQALRSAAIVVLIYSLLDLVMYVVCFNKASYALIYTTMGMASLIVIYWRVIARTILQSIFRTTTN